MQASRIFIAALSLVFSSQTFALTPPKPTPVGYIAVSDGPVGAYKSDITSLQYDTQSQAIYFIASSDEFQFFNQQPVVGKSANFSYEKFGSYKCSGTANIKSVEYSENISTVIGAKPILNKLSLSFKADCKFTDGLMHAAVYRPLVGTLEYIRTKDTNSCTLQQMKIADLELENYILRQQLAQKSSETVDNSSGSEDSIDSEQLTALKNKISDLESDNNTLVEELKSKDQVLIDIKKTANKTKPKNVSSLKNLYTNLKKKLLTQ